MHGVKGRKTWPYILSPNHFQETGRGCTAELLWNTEKNVPIFLGVHRRFRTNSSSPSFTLSFPFLAYKLECTCLPSCRL